MVFRSKYTKRAVLRALPAALGIACVLSAPLSYAQSQAEPTGFEAFLSGANEPRDVVSNDSAMPQVDGLDSGIDLDVLPVETDIAIDMDPIGQSPAEIEREIREEAFDAVLTGLFPLEPDQIEQLLRRYNKNEELVVKPVDGMPTPEVSVQTVSLDPGAMPLTVKTSPGHITTLNILDVTGAPWPIQDVSWAGDFEVIEPEEGGHIIRMTPLSKFAYGNIAIRLLTLKTPVILSIKSDLSSVHYRFDARIPENGPYAQAGLIDNPASASGGAGSPMLTSVLDGVAPNGAQKMAVAGVDGRTSAYMVGNKTFVRTPLTLLSPGWQSSVASADGMNVYTIDGSAPVLLLSDNGRLTRAQLSEKKDLFDE